MRHFERCPLCLGGMTATSSPRGQCSQTQPRRQPRDKERGWEHRQENWSLTVPTEASWFIKCCLAGTQVGLELGVVGSGDFLRRQTGGWGPVLGLVL